jgi:membrane protease YdiL (CAAX protease family)
MKAFITKHPVATYFVLTLAISWGGFVLAIGPGGLASTDWQAEPRFVWAIALMLAGPTAAGLLVTGIVDGRAGLRDILLRLLKWRVNARWYAMALLLAPLLAGAVLLALKLTSPIFTDDKARVLVSGFVAGLSTVFEEIGWTGLAVPKLRRRYSVMTTGIIVGVVWGVWHLLQGFFVAGTYAAELPLALFVTLNFLGGVAQLTAYRVLLVWVYDRTGSLLVVTLMHASLTACTIFIFRPIATGVPFLAFGWILTAALWAVVAAIAVMNGGELTRSPAAARAT